MFKKASSPITSVALIISIAALALSSVSLSRAGSSLNEEEITERVEKGIETYIAKKNAEAGGGPVDASIDDDAMKGDKNAPVTIVEFSDFECPYCRRFAEETLPEIISEYIDKGKVRLVHRDFPLDFHRNAKPAAMAAECAREQEGDKMYYNYHDKIYANQDQLSPESLKQWASELDLNTAEFNECLDSEKYSDEVNADFAEAQSYGVNGTPAFFINGQRVSGAQPFSVFKTIIDEELAK